MRRLKSRLNAPRAGAPDQPLARSPGPSPGPSPDPSQDPSQGAAPPGGLTPEQIDLVFRAFLDRPPAPEARKTLIAGGITLNKLRRSLLASAEFRALWSEHRADTRSFVHIHIPKTAGTSLNSLLVPLFPKAARIHGTGPHCETTLRAMSPEQRAQIRFVAGHVTYGIGSYLSAPVQYLTILRDPGPRVVSYYNFVRRRPQHGLYETVGRGNMDFGGFLEMAETRPMLRTELFSGQVRRLAGDMTARGFGHEQRLFDTACQHLAARNMTYGFTEEFAAFQHALVELGILPEVQNMRENVSPAGSGYEDLRAALTDAQRALLDRYNSWDEKLMHFARTRTSDGPSQ